MKTKVLLSTLFCFCYALLTFAQSTTNIDLKNSMIKWTGHAEVGSYAPSGTLFFKSGQIVMQNDNIKNALLIVDMPGMQQENSHLVEHLKSSDFFDVEKYPISTITITKVAKGFAYGQLTIKDKTLPLICPINIQKTVDKTVITGNIIIDRTLYGITYNSGSFFSGLGDKAIRNTFDVAFSVVINKNQ